MNKIYYLNTCATCRRILKEIPALQNFVLQEIKSERISAEQLDELQQMTGSYELLFSRKSQKYRPLGLHELQLSEADYRRLLLQEYSFLKRPVIVVGQRVFAGSAAQTLAEALTLICIEGKC